MKVSKLCLVSSVGDTIDDAVREAFNMAFERRQVVELEFNSVKILIDPEKIVNTLIEVYYEQLKK